MSAEFVDTNILIYAFDPVDPKKHAIAQKLILTLSDAGIGALSIQVLSEFYSISTRKLKHPPERTHRTLEGFQFWAIHSPRHADLLRATTLQQRHQISWWDALIVNSAQQLNAAILWTEDLNHNQRYDNLIVKNPFLD